MTYEQIRYDTHGRVAVITLNRPEALNAVTNVMNGELLDAFKAAGEDSGIGCIVVTGAGRAFCAGADVKAFQSGLEGGQGYGGAWGPGGRLDTIYHTAKPVLAAINGVAVGVGATMPLACDIRVASEAAQIGFTFRRIGLAPEFGSTYTLARIVGLGRAMDLCLRGRMLSAQEALAIGLVTEVLPADGFLDAALAIAADIANGPTQALATAKEGLHLGLDSSLADAEKWEYTVGNPRLRGGAEYREGDRAFAEKRAPRWHDAQA